MIEKSGVRRMTRVNNRKELPEGTVWTTAAAAAACNKQNVKNHCALSMKAKSSAE
jgi:hypothetical protein